MKKDPDAKLPFTVDWTDWLAAEGDTASSVTWTVPVGLTQEADPAPVLQDGQATVWLSGGTAGQVYRVTCRLTTAAGRVDERSFDVRVGHR